MKHAYAVILLAIVVFAFLGGKNNNTTNTDATNTLLTINTIASSNDVYFNLAFNSIPNTAVISFNGVEYNGGNVVSIASGNYPINAFAQANFTFNYWSGNNASFVNSASPNTIVEITGNSTITANFNGITTFLENGLPTNARWNMTYDDLYHSVNAPGNITFLNYPGRYQFTVANVLYDNQIYVPTPQNGYVSAGNLSYINFAINTTTPSTISTTSSTTSTTITSISTSSTSTIYNYSETGTNAALSQNLNSSSPMINNMQAFLLDMGMRKNAVFISNISINSTYENSTSENSIEPITLSYQEMSNMTSLNQLQVKSVMSYLHTAYNGNLQLFNRTVNVTYGEIAQNNSYAVAGGELNYTAFNMNGIVTLYKIRVKKAVPHLAISADGATVSAPNTTSKIYVPILPGQKTYTLSLSLNSALLGTNTANYSYSISFSNGTVINKKIDAGVISYSKTFILNTDETANITFSTDGNSNYTSEDPGSLIIPSSIDYYLPITLNNNQASPTPAPFQDSLSVNSLQYNQYEANSLDNIEFFYANGNVIPSWMEGSASNTLLNSPANSIRLYTSTNTVYWLNISSGMPANNGITVYMGFAGTSSNLLNNIDVGEAPQISSTYAQYDDGNHVFDYYNVNPSSKSGWTVAGTAGQTSSAPAGSHYATTNALYANSANGDYMYTSIPSLAANEIISFDVYTTGLGDFFFLANSAGKGQMARLDGRGGSDYSGIATTTSWTSWAAPTGISESKDIWYKYDVAISGSSAYAYIGSISNNLETFGTKTSSSAFSISNNGKYLGLIGDGLGSSYITYWDGVIVRAYPPNGVMPSATFGSVASSSSPTLVIQANPVIYGNKNLMTATAPNGNGDTVELESNGNIIAGPATNTVSYTICGSAPSLANCWAPGSYTITVNDLTSGLSSSAILIIDKATPQLTLTSPGVIFSGGSTQINFGISTVGNQIPANLIVNGANVMDTYTTGAYSMTPSNGLNYIEVATAGNGNYMGANQIGNACAIPAPSGFPSNILYYAPICVLNNQTFNTQANFQQIINITESAYSDYMTYNGNVANFEIFNSIGAVQPAWIEKNQSGILVTWVNISTGIASNSAYPLYIGFAANTVNLLSASGSTGIGEIPTATSSYAQYDDGASVFDNYFSGNSVTGWTVAGTAGQSTSAPSGSPFGTDAFYANGANGDYLYTAANSQSTNMIIEYYTNTANLDDLFFLVNSAGAGQIGRVGNGGGWYGIASASSWTSWTAPPDSGTWSNEWLLLSIVVQNGNAVMYLSTNPGIYGSEMGQNASNVYTVANDGGYIGLVGDAAGSSTIQYWDGIIVRAYPPNGVMPSALLGSIIPIQSTCTISLGQGTIDFGVFGSGSSIGTVNSITDTNSGNTNANVLVYGSGWSSGSSSFGVSNTVWSGTVNSPYGSSTRLSSSPVSTGIQVSASGNNNIYFGIGVPGGAPEGSYTQTITIENSC